MLSEKLRMRSLCVSQTKFLRSQSRLPLCASQSSHFTMLKYSLQKGVINALSTGPLKGLAPLAKSWQPNPSVCLSTIESYRPTVGLLGYRSIVSSAMTFIRAGTAPSTSTAAKQIGSKLISRHTSSQHLKAMPLGTKFGTRRSYVVSGFETLQKQWEQQQKEASKRPWFWRLLGLFSALPKVLNAFSLYYLHATLHKDNPSYVSYLSFVPLLDWLPALDLANLSRAWILLPAALVGIASALPSMVAASMAFLFIAPIYAFEIYRSYHLLEHYEVRNWPLILLWSFTSFGWLITSGLAILGADRRQLVPHHQASFSESVTMTIERLDASIENPKIVEDNNYAFWTYYMLWEHVPGLRNVPGHVSWLYHSLHLDTAAVKVQEAGEYISSLWSRPPFPAKLDIPKPVDQHNSEEKKQ